MLAGQITRYAVNHGYAPVNVLPSGQLRGTLKPVKIESHAAITYSQYLENGDYYWSITVPSLIVGTCGGGTGLPTQRQCMEMLGCYGPGKAKKLAEICAAVVLAGETSLAAAMIHGDWVAAHERLGRNRPAR